MKHFTSDTHFFHENIIKYSKRPYANVAEMNEALIANWNSVVKPGDEVYHLGDFGFAAEDKLVNVIKRLNGQIHFIFGNHDKLISKSTALKDLFTSVSSYKEIYLQNSENPTGKTQVVLCHFPMIVWNKSHHGSFMLHGHCHGNLKYPFENPARIMDVGVDPQGYFPISEKEVLARLNKIPNFRQHHPDE